MALGNWIVKGIKITKRTIPQSNLTRKIKSSKEPPKIAPNVRRSKAITEKATRAQSKREKFHKGLFILKHKSVEKACLVSVILHPGFVRSPKALALNRWRWPHWVLSLSYTSSPRRSIEFLWAWPNIPVTDSLSIRSSFLRMNLNLQTLNTKNLW